MVVRSLFRQRWQRSDGRDYTAVGCPGRAWCGGAEASLPWLRAGIATQYAREPAPVGRNGCPVLAGIPSPAAH